MNRRGFTLIETLISIILLSICLTGGMAFYFNSSAIMALTVHKKMAMEIGNQALEKYKEMGYNDLPAATGNWVADTAVTFGEFTVQTRRKITQVVNGPPETKQVEFEVKWNEAGQQEARTVNLLTYIASL